MTFKAAKCPNCAGDIQVPDERAAVKCMYCGSDIIVREAIKAAAGGVNIDNLMMLAKSAEKVENNKEAYKYYSSILEHDMQNSIAWIGKGKTCKTFDDSDDIATLKECFINALSCAGDRVNIEKDIKAFLYGKINKTFGFDYRFVHFANLLYEIDHEDIQGLIARGQLLCNPDGQVLCNTNTDDSDAIVYFNKAITLSNNSEEIKERITKAIIDFLGNKEGSRLSKVIKILQYRGGEYSSCVSAIFSYLDKIDLKGSSIPFKRQLIADIEWAAENENLYPDTIAFKAKLINQLGKSNIQSSGAR